MLHVGVMIWEQKSCESKGEKLGVALVVDAMATSTNDKKRDTYVVNLMAGCKWLR